MDWLEASVSTELGLLSTDKTMFGWSEEEGHLKHNRKVRPRRMCNHDWCLVIGSIESEIGGDIDHSSEKGCWTSQTALKRGTSAAPGRSNASVRTPKPLVSDLSLKISAVLRPPASQWTFSERLGVDDVLLSIYAELDLPRFHSIRSP